MNNIAQLQFSDKRYSMTTITSKEPERAKIQSDIEEFLANGGKVTVLESGKDLMSKRALGSESVIGGGL